MDELSQRVQAEFRRHYGADATLLVRAPGRVNLIGEHTDYNDGFVLPLAINRAVWIALRPRSDNQVVVHSLDFEASEQFDTSALSKDDGWQEYMKGVAWVLQTDRAPLSGWEGVMAGNVPVGAGLSSSAALELATARAFAAVNHLPWDAATMALAGQRAENKWVGVNCGIMDQMISAAGQEGHALLIDCRTLALEPVPLPAGTAVVILDTQTRRGLVDSAYNERRAQCEAAAAYFGVAALRDVTLEELAVKGGGPAGTGGGLDEVTLRRARHVVGENARVLQAVEAMRAGDAERLGQLMNASHASLRDDYEVSSFALNSMVRCAQAQPGCFGARMTGAGFGGCAVALVADEAVATFVPAVSACYEAETGRAPSIYVTQATEGAEIVR